jgi:hypothetical protein
MVSTELEYAEKRMRQKWYDLVMAEQNGAAMPVLERMYNAYMLAVEEYNRCSATASAEPAEQASSATPQRALSPTHPVQNGKRRRKAS